MQVTPAYSITEIWKIKSYNITSGFSNYLNSNILKTVNN